MSVYPVSGVKGDPLRVGYKYQRSQRVNRIGYELVISKECACRDSQGLGYLSFQFKWSSV